MSSPKPSSGRRPEWKAWSNVVPSRLRYCCFIYQFIKFTFIFFLCLRQHLVLKANRHVPLILREKIPRQNFERARNYQMSLNFLKMASCVYWVGHEFLMISLAGFTGMWFDSGPLLDYFDFWPEEWDRETGESIIFIWIIVFHFNAAPMPLDLWKTFVIEDNYGFNKMSLIDFLVDWLKLFFLELIFGTVIGIGILWIVQETGAYFVLWLWLFSFIWLMLGIGIYPNAIAPIFDTYTPLREGRLKARLRKLAHFLGFPLDDILVLHQSWRTEHRKVYMYGLLGAKRIVIYDTLLAGYTEADEFSVLSRVEIHATLSRRVRSQSLESVPSRILENVHLSSPENNAPGTAAHTRATVNDYGFTEYEIEAVVARQMGRWILGHTVKELVYPIVSMFLFYLIFAWVYEHSSIYHALASMEGQLDKPILLGLRLIYADVLDVYRVCVEWIMKYFNRQRYYEADAFAAKLGYGSDLIDCYIEAEKENLEYPYFDSWYWNFHFSEPPLLDRIHAIKKEERQMQWKVE